jgi:hypothetical protein
MKVGLGVFGAIAIVLVLMAPKLGWVWLLAPIPILYVVVISEGLAVGPSSRQFLGDYASGGIVAGTVGCIWAGETHRVSPLFAVLAATVVAGVLATLAQPYGPSRVASRLGNVLKRYGTAFSAVGRETKSATQPIDPIGCAVALVLGLAFAVLLLVGGVIVEVVIVPVGLVLFGTVSAPLGLALDKRAIGKSVRRIVPGIALAFESGLIVALGIAMLRK